MSNVMLQRQAFPTDMSRLSNFFRCIGRCLTGSIILSRDFTCMDEYSYLKHRCHLVETCTALTYGAVGCCTFPYVPYVQITKLKLN